LSGGKKRTKRFWGPRKKGKVKCRVGGGFGTGGNRRRKKNGRGEHERNLVDI